MVSPPGKKSSANKYSHKQKQKRTVCVWKERKRGDTESVFGLQDSINISEHAHGTLPDELQMSAKLWIFFAGTGFTSRSTEIAVGDSTLSFDLNCGLLKRNSDVFLPFHVRKFHM